jgi:hypothetical protein
MPVQRRDQYSLNEPGVPAPLRPQMHGVWRGIMPLRHQSATSPRRNGPKASVLNLERDRRENIRKSFQAKKPANGWPK